MLPGYWIERPPLQIDRPTQSAIEEFLSRTSPDAVNRLEDVDTVLRGGGMSWKFLCGLADRRTIAFHGTGAMYYAIVDRDRYRVTLNNGCIVLMDADGRPGPPRYYFSISRGALRRRPWRAGYVYLLPAEGFVEQPSGTYAGHVARVPQLASPVAVTPFARLRVAPDDFPFLAHVRGHDDERLAEYADAVIAAAPWPE